MSVLLVVLFDTCYLEIRIRIKIRLGKEVVPDGFSFVSLSLSITSQYLCLEKKRDKNTYFQQTKMTLNECMCACERPSCILLGYACVYVFVCVVRAFMCVCVWHPLKNQLYEREEVPPDRRSEWNTHNHRKRQDLFLVACGPQSTPIETRERDPHHKKKERHRENKKKKKRKGNLRVSNNEQNRMIDINVYTID